MTALRNAAAEAFSCRLAQRIDAVLHGRGVALASEALNLQVHLAFQWADGLGWKDPADIERLAELVCRCYGGFPDGPLPRPAMKALYRRGASPSERLGDLERAASLSP